MLELLNYIAQSLVCLVLGLSGNSFPKPLDAKRERECFERMKNGDTAAKDELICHNLRLVAHVVKKYCTAPDMLDDLISIGTIGLIKAVSSFDSSKDTRFATYAARCIENEVLMHFRSNKKNRADVHLSDSIDSKGADGSLTIMDTLCDDTDISCALELKSELTKVRSLVKERLRGRERLIIEMRYGLGGHAPSTQQTTARALGISRSYVSRIEKKALETLKGEMQK